ncbi:MAG: hypothetical protein WAR77_00280, partial [Saprospiraceae bacterium]
YQEAQNCVQIIACDASTPKIYLLILLQQDCKCVRNDSILIAILYILPSQLLYYLLALLIILRKSFLRSWLL